jgi:hypothetical protein
LHDVHRVDLRDRVPDLDAALLTGRGRNDWIQRHRNRAKLEVQRRRLPGGDCHGLTPFRETDAQNPHFRAARIDAADGVLALVICHSTEASAKDAKLR